MGSGRRARASCPQPPRPAQVRALADAGVAVMGHIGLCPQSHAAHGGYRVQGRTAESAHALLEDALALLGDST